ncbi:hypothetical protein GWG65_29720 [Bradyrhizobium sp. CSA207]|uniref:hypothetical protein n=1 Tax=Bradyrhizobium sp. CSA207 TaxID=2698826 RepID=UPI0023B077FF|nr:hypothetical protein [Bradyrhizobium sp. CSA207]MDE5445531.1 hypothetical protein [Bradyrhizobium sp. CSA207]
MMWIFVGVAVTAFSVMASAHGGVIIVAWGAILFGVVQLLFSRRDSGVSAGVDDLINDVSEGVRTLIAVNAGVIRDPSAPTANETQAFQLALQDAAKSLGILIHPIPESRIGEIALAMTHVPMGVAGYLKKKSKYLTPELKALIARSAFDVASVDRPEHEVASVLRPITEALNVDDSELNALERR